MANECTAVHLLRFYDSNAATNCKPHHARSERFSCRNFADAFPASQKEISIAQLVSCGPFTAIGQRRPPGEKLRPCRNFDSRERRVCTLLPQSRPPGFTIWARQPARQASARSKVICSTKIQPDCGLSRSAWQRIRRKANQLSRRSGFTLADRDDIEQELAFRLWQTLRHFKPSRGEIDRFISTVLHRAGVSLLRERNSSRRGRNVAHIPIDADSIASAAILADAPLADELDLIHDVAAVLDRLPASLRDLAEQLKNHSVAEIARNQNVSRTTVYAGIHELRERFGRAGLANSR